MLRYPTSCRNGLLVLGLLLALPAPVVAREAEYDVAVETDVMVPMRDGVRLATDVYRPARDGTPVDEPRPAIVTRLPYGKGGQKGIGRYYAARGYVFIAQDTRGRFNSEGVWHMLTDDGPDGYDTAEWILAQPWSDGKFGMMGTSYFGGTQHAAAMADAPGLATVIPVDAMSNLGYQSMRNAGAFELRFWNWTLRDAARGSRQARDPGTAAVLREMFDHRKAYLANLPLRRGTTPLKLAEEYEDWLVEAMKEGANSDFWKVNNIIDYTEQYKDIPVYLVGGWYDSWGGNTTANYMALSETIDGPVYLIMGPWIHNAQSRSAHGQVSFGPDAAMADHLGWRLQWFDRWLKGHENAVGREAPFATPVRIFVMGTGDGRRTGDGMLYHGGSWRDEHEWPLARTRYTEFTAKLIDVYPPSDDFPGGFDLLLGDGIVRTRFRESLAREKLMAPGEVYPVAIKLYPTSNVFKKGHRIRVDISSSNFPRFDINPNTGEPLNEHRRLETAVNTVYHDPQRPSHIRLPVIPR